MVPSYYLFVEGCGSYNLVFEFIGRQPATAPQQVVVKHGRWLLSSSGESLDFRFVLPHALLFHRRASLCKAALYLGLHTVIVPFLGLTSPPSIVGGDESTGRLKFPRKEVSYHLALNLMPSRIPLGPH